MPGQNPQPQSSPDSFKLQEFGGMLPAWDDHLLPDGQAASSLNAYLFSGALVGWRTPKLLYTLKNSAAQFAYRLPNQTSSIANALVYLLSNPENGDELTLGEEVYRFVTATVTTSYDVLIGATAADSVTNLFNAFTFDNGLGTNQGITYGAGTVANPAIDQTSPATKNILATDIPRIEVFAPDNGAAYNSTTVSDDTGGVRIQWKYNGAPTSTFQGGINLQFDASITSSSTWLEFLDPDTDVMRSPVVDDSFDRYYFASPSVAPQYNTRARIQAGQSPWLLGVPAPGCAPGVSVEGGGNSVQLGFPNTIATDNASPGANIIYLVQVMPGGAMILNDISAMPADTNLLTQFAGVLYSDNNGVPDQLINTGVPVMGITAGTAITSSFTNPTGLLMNVPYWIGFMTDQADAYALADDTGSAGFVVPNTFSNGPPPVISGGAVGFPDLQMWGDLTSESVLEARSYVYTYVTAYDEEGPPSPATIVTGWSNGTWTIDLFTPPPDQMGVTRNITSLRIYRTITAQSGATTYYQVTGTVATNGTDGVDLPVTTAQYTDIITDDVLVAYPILSSQLWSPPPENLQGVIAMPNGMAVGFKDNEIWFCEPYRPHAWPESYVLTTEYPIVGLGVTGSSVVACTSGSPYIATGVNPGSMSGLKVQNSEPCNARGSVLGNNDGVYYSSPNGLILVTQYGAVTNTTELWITREKWRALAPQKNLRSVFLVSSYFSLGTVRDGDNSVAQQGFTIELNPADAQSFTIWPQPGGHRLGFNSLSGPNALDVVNVRIDPWSATCLLLQGGAIYYYDFSDQQPVMQTYDWKSKLYQQKSKKNLEAMRIWFDIPPGTPALNPTRLENPTTDPIWDTLPADRYGFIKVYAAGRLVTVREIRVPQELMRIVSGFKAETWQFEIVARIPISNIQVGTSVKALAST